MKKKSSKKSSVKPIPESIAEQGTSFIIKIRVSSDSKNMTERILHKCLSLANNSNLGLGFIKSCLFKNSVVALEELGLELDERTKNRLKPKEVIRYLNVQQSNSTSNDDDDDDYDEYESSVEDELEDLFPDDEV